jgi:hypothetical protein
MDLNVLFYSSTFLIFTYLNYKITNLEKELITYKMVDDILNMKILNLENNIKNLEDFRLEIYKNNLSTNNVWEDDDDDDEMINLIFFY